MESIQLAQMLADLSDLNAAVGQHNAPSLGLHCVLLVLILGQQESHSATALVNANKTHSPASASTDSSKSPEQAQTRPGLRNHHRTGSTGSAGSGSWASRTASPAKFDKYGRRILTPPNTRSNSVYGSIPGTPRQTEVSKSPQTAHHALAFSGFVLTLK